MNNVLYIYIRIPFVKRKTNAQANTVVNDIINAFLSFVCLSDSPPVQELIL